MNEDSKMDTLLGSSSSIDEEQKNLLANVESLEITEDATQDPQRSIGEDVLSSGDLDMVSLNSDRTDAQDDTKPSNDVHLLTANDNKDQQENEQVEKYVLSFDDLPYLVHKKVLKFLTIKDIHNLMLACKEYYYKFGKLAPSTGKWKIQMMSKTANENMEILKAAKERQNNIPRDLEIKFKFKCCIYLNGDRFWEVAYKSLNVFKCLEPIQILFRDWAENITSLEMEILGNETFLMDEVICPKLESLSFQIYPNCTNQTSVDIIYEFTKKHVHGLKRFEIVGDYKHPLLFKFPSYMPCLEHCKLTRIQPDDINTLLNNAHQTLVSLEIVDDIDNFPNYQIDFNYRPESLKHLLVMVHYRNISSAFLNNLLPQVAGQLITLKVFGSSLLPSILASCPTFSNLKLLFFYDHETNHCLYKFPEVEIIVNLDISDGRVSDAIKLPKLKTLVVDHFDPWSLQMIHLNSGMNIS